ncbi:Phosphatidylinositol kinase OS=Kitasatospora aureofaciens OX=1894 GN=GCM10010502_70150 PE=4 SV=1 [Kitasatospora aureofaciens]|uniref:Phosphatidylinositol kinase n=1 Tax=Kitasatospora aureofaciens TaxID=1894 RepID=A0A8H9I1T9_KITAU|nr:phosphatidylinositol kinase [Kitasatospora aureofaciens]QEV02294.1 SCO1664 family protein [Streptomyces viridifaciens]GGV05218.1 phosphatidylinositol kinase [Kitasatospora aureofaciens]
MPARERLPALNTETPPQADPAAAAALAADAPTALALLRQGALTVHGRLTEASNAALYCTVEHGSLSAQAVYKPVAGERPLWDFPDGTLAGREVAAYELSAATGWELIPPTVLREGPHGPGMLQLWVEPDPRAEPLLALQDPNGPEAGWLPIVRAEVEDGRTALLVHHDDRRLRRLAVLDAVLNNADRKGGHLIPAADGRVYGIDHGVTFNTEGKLRTLLWGWAGDPLPAEALEVLSRLARELEGELAERLAPHLTGAELDATRARVAALRSSGRHPLPSADWPAIPWPPV